MDPGDEAAPALEAPSRLLGRLKLGREEFCQRLLTMLILDGPYPRWNTRSRVSPAGLSFLRALYLSQFGEPWPGDDLEFVDEFELPGRHEGETGGAPDYAVLWPGRVWLIELKTEKGSHRRGQIPGYFELAHHHHPDARVDITYLTPPMAAAYEPRFEWARYRHVTWPALEAAISGAWPGERHGPHVRYLLDAIASLHLKPTEWRAMATGTLAEAAEWAGAAADEAPPLPLDRALPHGFGAAELTAQDGRQRGVEFDAGEMQDLLDLRLALRDRLASSPIGSDLRRVVPWIWRTESTGKPLTALCADRGMELRVSRYKTDQYR